MLRFWNQAANSRVDRGSIQALQVGRRTADEEFCESTATGNRCGTAACAKGSTNNLFLKTFDANP